MRLVALSVLLVARSAIADVAIPSATGDAEPCAAPRPREEICRCLGRGRNLPCSRRSIPGTDEAVLEVDNDEHENRVYLVLSTPSGWSAAFHLFDEHEAMSLIPISLRQERKGPAGVWWLEYSWSDRLFWTEGGRRLGWNNGGDALVACALRDGTRVPRCGSATRDTLFNCWQAGKRPIRGRERWRVTLDDNGRLDATALTPIHPSECHPAFDVLPRQLW
jgi:hypothetical protein